MGNRRRTGACGTIIFLYSRKRQPVLSRLPLSCSDRSHLSSADGPAAVDFQFRSLHVVGLVGSKKDGRCSNLLRFSRSPGRNVLQPFIINAFRHRCINKSWSNQIRFDAFTAKVVRQLFCKSMYSMFARYVGIAARSGTAALDARYGPFTFTFINLSNVSSSVSTTFL